MQPYPQPPAQNIPSQRPWWLIYGVSFGVGLGLIIIALSRFVGADLSIFFDLIYFSACLVAGILAARETRRAGLATLAGLLVGLFFILSTFLFSIVRYGAIRYASLLGILLLALLGIYVGFLGGLIGRNAERTRRTIGLFYAVGFCFSFAAAIALFGGLFTVLYFSSSSLVIADVSVMIIGSLCGMVAWIMTLVQFAQAQSWGNFTLTFFFSGIMVLVYLIAGAQPRQPAPYGAFPPVAYVPTASAYPPMSPAPYSAFPSGAYPPMPAQPPQPDAVTILQQRFARGEIDAETYRQMLATLTSPPTNPPHP